MTIEVIDSDSGLEFGDDLLYSANVTVPWCSVFHADVATAECDEDYAYKCDVWVSIFFAVSAVRQRLFIRVSLVCGTTSLFSRHETRKLYLRKGGHGTAIVRSCSKKCIGITKRR